MRVRLKGRREQAGFSQQALAGRAGVARQTLNAIEAGRQNPSVMVALRLARLLGCGVEDLFVEDVASVMDADMVHPAVPHRALTDRVSLGRVAGRWVAHALDGTDYGVSDGVTSGAGRPVGPVRVKAFANQPSLEKNVLVAGCAPLLATLARRVEDRFSDARMRWIRGSSGRALDLLDDGSVHIAGIHFVDDAESRGNAGIVEARFRGANMVMMNLVSWRQGLLVPKGNPLAIAAGDLARPGLTVAWREAGAGARTLLLRAMQSAGLGDTTPPPGPVVSGHLEVAQAVASGAADVGVAIEAAAAAFDLDFLPLESERFDLVFSDDTARQEEVGRILDAVDSPAFRAEVKAFRGYATDLTGHSIHIGA